MDRTTEARVLTLRVEANRVLAGAMDARRKMTDAFRERRITDHTAFADLAVCVGLEMKRAAELESFCQALEKTNQPAPNHTRN